MNKRTARVHEMNVGLVQSRRFIGHQPSANFDACFTQLEAIGGSMLLPADRAELVALIAYGLERLNQFQRAA